jgi:hypothetical protein
MREKPKQDDAEQSKRFIDTAREIGADETKEGADRAFKKVAPSKPAKAGRD